VSSPELRIDHSPIPGLLVLRLPVHGDERGWFKETWQRQKMVDAGLPDFEPVQNNVSFNARAGATRGVHAEPWDKFVSLATGRIFGTWVDLREGESFGTVFTLEMGPETAVFVPRGVGNGFQPLEDGTAYTYLVNDHWSAGARDDYTFVNLADPELAIAWPIPLAEATLSEADRAHPRLADVRPFRRKRTLVIGAGGNVGRALALLMPGADTLGRQELDLIDPASWERVPWADYDVIVNAAAYTAVDHAETQEGRRSAWEVNVTATGRLVQIARRHRATLVTFSSDYVFDGTKNLHDEAEPFSPLGVYGQTKAAADALTATYPRHYIVRTSWVVGDGKSFVRTMAELADRGVSPSVIDDQVGRLSFAEDLARAVDHLVTTGAPFGTYNVTSSGDAVTWADLAREVFAARGRSPEDVRRVSTEEYAASRAIAPRPRHSVLDLSKIEATGFVPSDGRSRLMEYLQAIDHADGALPRPRG
jgi:dTDP-4-dehydrorhamnose 3,5-epimerase/reductase